FRRDEKGAARRFFHCRVTPCTAYAQGCSLLVRPAAGYDRVSTCTHTRLSPMATFAERKPAPNIETLRVPPHSIEAEQAVLGGLMLAPDSWENVADRIGEEDFYRRDHRVIFRAIATLS